MSPLKRRKYKRYEINLAATLIVNSADLIQCVIRDFCSGGLFIELGQRNNLDKFTAQQKLQVRVSINNEQGNNTFTQEIQIMHVNSIGLGVAFEGDSETFFSALKEEAHIHTNSSSAGMQRSSVNAEIQEKLENDLTSLLKKELLTIISQFYSEATKKIKETVTQSENYHEQVILQDTATNLQINKETLFKNFCSSSTNKISLLASSSVFDQADETQEESALSLVEKEDFEDWLNLSEIIRSLESIFEADLDSLLNKLAYILKIDKNLIVNPISPANICGLFRDALIDIEKNELTKNWLYTAFGDTLSSLLSSLFNKMDAILLKHGAPEKLVFSSTNNREVQRNVVITPTDNNPVDEGQSSDNIISQTETVNHTADQKISGEATSAGNNNFQNERSNDTSISKTESVENIDNNHKISTPVATMVKEVKADDTFISTRETKQILNVVSNLASLLQNQNTPLQKKSGREEATEKFSSEEITKALAHIQQQALTQSSQQDPIALKKTLQQTLDNISSDDKNLSTTDKNNLDVQESLFEVLYDDTLLAQESQSYLQRIQLPIMAQAMQDTGFLESNDSPARNIVNHLYWLESAIKDNKTVKNSHIKEIIDPLIEQLSNKSLDDPSIFSSVEEKLSNITESVNKSVASNIKRVHETYEGKQKLEDARHFVQNEINRHFVGKKIPKILITLLESGWQHLLVIAKLNDDRQSYQRHLLTIFNLITWLTGEKKFSKNLAKTTLEIIDTHLQPISANAFLHTNILSELRRLLLESDLQTGSDVVEMAIFEADKSIVPPPTLKKIKDEVSQLRIGEWLTFFLENTLESLKLVWISKFEDIFVFVDRNGIKKLELKRNDLVDLIKSGAVNPIESLDLPVMDRATNKMVQNLHEKLIFNATRDPVTGLLNRKEFIKQLKLELAGIDNAKYLLCNIEIQDFRIITNTCGLSAGDTLLNQLASTLKEQQHKRDIYCRLDDRTFSILLVNRHPEFAKKLQSTLITSEFKWEDKSYAIAVSMGIVPLFSGNNYDIDNIFRRADSATLSASNAGRNRIRVYKDNDEALKSQYNAHEWVGRINQVFAENRLFLRCQQIAAIDPETDSHMHYEILLGIKDENGNTIPPDDFIPAVERCQRMSEIDQWVVQSVFDWIEQHLEIFEQLDGVSINLSGESMNSEEFLDFLRKLLASSSIPLEKITFEITETVAADSFHFVQTFIKKIKRFNCKFSLDDFGSGYSSYSYLKSLDVDYLKIDGIFVKDMPNNPTDVAIVKSMNEIAHSLNLKTIAEYVENDAILAILKDMGVDYAQGWGIQKPILLNDLK